MCLVITSLHYCQFKEYTRRYLSNKQRVQLLNVLDTLPEVFSEIPGLFKVNAYYDYPLYPISNQKDWKHTVCQSI